MLQKTGQITGVELLKGFTDVLDFVGKTLHNIDQVESVLGDYTGHSVRTSALYNLTQDDKGYYIEFEVPGVDISEVGIEVKDGTITIIVDQKQESAARKVRYQMKKYLILPTDVAQKEISANLKSGILKITLPKVKPVVKEGQKVNITEG